MMGTPEEKVRKRMRIRSHVAKDLASPKYRQRVKQNDKLKKEKIDATKLTHAELVKMISKDEQDYDE